MYIQAVTINLIPTTDSGGDDKMSKGQDGSRKRIPNFIDKLKEVEKTKTKEPKQYLTKLRRLARNELRFLGAEKRTQTKKLTMNSVRTYLTDYRNAVKELNIINPKARKQIIALQKKFKRKYPEISSDFDTLSKELPALRESYLNLREKLASLRHSDALAELKKIKIEHPIFYYLKIDAGTAEVLKTEWKKKLNEKHQTTFTIGYKRVMEVIEDGFNSTSVSKVTLALALATGRRAIEILQGGEFKLAEDNQLMFYGQVKTKREAEPEPYIIPVLPGLKALEVLRQFDRFCELPTIKRFGELEDDIEKGLSAFDQINRATASDLNKYMRYAFRSNEHEHTRYADYKRLETEGEAPKTLMFKDSRAIYLRICLDHLYNPDLGITEEKYVASLLGHGENDLTTQLSYKGVCMDYELISWDEKVKFESKKKIKADKLTTKHLTRCDERVAAYRSKPMIRMHEWLKNHMEKPAKGDEDLELSRGVLRKRCNANAATVDAYLDMIGLTL